MGVFISVLAAVLAVLGYSVNESVVVADRIRENFRRMRKASVVDTINNAITRTMSRTIITHGTTETVVLAMLIFGGQPFIISPCPYYWNSIWNIFFHIRNGTNNNLAWYIKKRSCTTCKEKRRIFRTLRNSFIRIYVFPAPYSHNICSVRKNSTKFFFGIL